MWPRTFMVRSWFAPRGFCVHCILYSKVHLAAFMFLLYVVQSTMLGFFSSSPAPLTAGECVPPSFCSGGVHTRLHVRVIKLRSWCDHVNWPFGVKKISINWLWPVKVTLKVIKRRLKVFCWSCDGVPLKWNKKNCRASSLSLRIKWAYSRLSIRMIGQYL